jgi:hypothetical protein
MNRRGVIFGQPRCVVWSSALAGVVFVIVLCGLLFGVVVGAINSVMQNVHRSDEGSGFFVQYWIGWGVAVVVWWWLSGTQRRFFRRFKRLNGRVCLACGREFDEGAVDHGVRCGKCGWVWSLDGLGKKWKKAAGVER